MLTAARPSATSPTATRAALQFDAALFKEVVNALGRTAFAMPDLLLRPPDVALLHGRVRTPAVRAMQSAILVLNAGSSSLKFALYHVVAGKQLARAAEGQVDEIGTNPQRTVRDAAGRLLTDRPLGTAEGADHRGAIAAVRAWLLEHPVGAPLAAVGHRVVHGGSQFGEPVRVDAPVLAALAAALGGLDALVFCGGIGESAAAIRARVCADAAWLGVQLDAIANRAGGPRLSPQDAPASAWVVRTDENLMIARHTVRVLAHESTTG